MSMSGNNTTTLADLTNGLTSDPKTWKNSHLISVTQISTSGLLILFQTAQSMRSLVRTKGGDSRLQHRVLASVFYEASTRTSCSFQAAIMRLGGTFIHVDGGKGGNTSASKKGESLEDTIRCLECYTDVTVLRHPTTGSVQRVALGGGTVKPVINAGDGVGEHPTQALLDAFTIWDELGLSLDVADGDSKNEKTHKGQLIIVMLGDLKHGRTVHSLAKLLARSSIKHELVLRYCAPSSLEMPSHVKEYVEKFPNAKQEEYTDMREAVKGANVLYVTRVQKERFEHVEDYEKVKGAYVVDTSLMKSAPSGMIVMHPLPRVDEIATEVDSDPRACYFRQMENGMFVRMAILALILGTP
mmetsp:Transcript_43250/g.77722  ORF Transcript_43250/g.77722 Transcript_43250/m.77722 type:complete len:356 (-) Transcript_43250:99-1166(-)|eukprot:CAMPEP_0201920530 /NCGR_PEP_ID=MMETSP0903-20130614/9128_1 /ASSEMBLY_ACC=CAM_ASM_000552 /TAXON_ID=420261 /ORGANISM="Thalassiosira antarctica, Strain CCMP982" /LENGTH=355 /DNA_ID=CAMNT_0048457307 /DNA_START=63 /DNA_END=1130 /DNA_ORIENTATION=+